jgi:addiction module RelE/StbE family toxin
MQIIFHKRFKKQFLKFPKRLQLKIEKTLILFEKNPQHISLKNHVLSGKMKDTRAISVNGDIRIIFQEFEHYTLVIILNIGGHEQVYK